MALKMTVKVTSALVLVADDDFLFSAGLVMPPLQVQLFLSLELGES